MSKLKKKEYRFTVIIEPCKEGGFFAKYPAFQGCQVQRETYEETMSEMKLAIEAFIADYREENEPIPDEDITVTSLKIAV